MLAAPGVNPNNYSAYGSGGTSSNAYMVDGVDVSDPESGTIWLFANHNWIQEVQVIGLGAERRIRRLHRRRLQQPVPVAAATCSRAVRNAVRERRADRRQRLGRTARGQRDLTPGNDRLRDRHHDPDRRADQARQALVLHELPGTTVRRRRRPVIRRRRPRATRSPASGRSARLEKSPRFLFKPTMKIGAERSADGILRDRQLYGRRSRAASAPGDRRTEATLHQDSPEVGLERQLHQGAVSSSSVFDVKYSGFWGYYYLSPYNGDDTPGWYDVDERLLRSQLLLLLQRGPRPAPGQRQRHEVRVGIRGRAQPEVRRRVRAQLHQERVRLPRRHVRARALRRALLRLPVGRLSEGQHQHPVHRLRAGFLDDRLAS